MPPLQVVSPTPSDIEIAQAAQPVPIATVAERLGLEDADYEPYGHLKAKVLWGGSRKAATATSAAWDCRAPGSTALLHSMRLHLSVTSGMPHLPAVAPPAHHFSASSRRCGWRCATSWRMCPAASTLWWRASRPRRWERARGEGQG